MREILFRGKRLDNGEWVRGGFFKWLKSTHIVSNNIGTYAQTPWEVDPETVGQYTGLTDKNGKKIFEGDIIKSVSGLHRAISVVKYGEFEPTMFYDLLERYVRSRPKEKVCGLFAKSIKGEEMFLTNCSNIIEVIGNIHDNPELLKGGAE